MHSGRRWPLEMHGRGMQMHQPLLRISRTASDKSCPRRKLAGTFAAEDDVRRVVGIAGEPLGSERWGCPCSLQSDIRSWNQLPELKHASGLLTGQLARYGRVLKASRLAEAGFFPLVLPWCVQAPSARDTLRARAPEGRGKRSSLCNVGDPTEEKTIRDQNHQPALHCIAQRDSA